MGIPADEVEEMICTWSGLGATFAIVLQGWAAHFDVWPLTHVQTLRDDEP